MHNGTHFSYANIAPIKSNVPLYERATFYNNLQGSQNKDVFVLQVSGRQSEGAVFMSVLIIKPLMHLLVGVFSKLLHYFSMCSFLGC